MPTTSTINTSLSLTLDGQEVNCQLKSVEFTPPAAGASSVMLTACPDGQVTGPAPTAPGRWPVRSWATRPTAGSRGC